ncbi:MAG: hypothetical protein R2867_03200 [Caldilineaceae bacterium]
MLFSEQLQAAGYRNVLCGKWHVSGDEDPKDRGWEERAVTGAGATFHLRTIDDWRQGPRGQDSSGGERPRAMCNARAGATLPSTRHCPTVTKGL